MNLDVDLRHLLPEVRDQGNRGTCLAFAVTCAHEYSRLTNDNVTLHLSEEFLYWKGLEIGKPSGITSGMTFQFASDALENYGQPEDSLWPYDVSRDDQQNSYTPPIEALDKTKYYRGELSRIDKTNAAVVDVLDSNRVVIAAIKTSAALSDTNGGLIRMPRKDEVEEVGHAIVFVGYIKSTSGNYLAFRNSWGDEWGDGGYGYLPFDYFTNYGIDAFVLQHR